MSEPRPLLYVALGDSYTVGVGASARSRGFVPLLARHLASSVGRLVSIKNLAGENYSTDDVIRRALPELAVLSPDLASVLVGARDVMQRRSRDDFREALAWIYDAVSLQVPVAARVLALSIPDWSVAPAAGRLGDVAQAALVIGGLNAVARDEAVMRGFTWVELAEVSRGRDGGGGGGAAAAGAASDWFADDGMYPSNAQYAAWADAIWAAAAPAWAEPGTGSTGEKA